MKKIILLATLAPSIAFAGSLDGIDLVAGGIALIANSISFFFFYGILRAADSRVRVKRVLSSIVLLISVVLPPLSFIDSEYTWIFVIAFGAVGACLASILSLYESYYGQEKSKVLILISLFLILITSFQIFKMFSS